MIDPYKFSQKQLELTAEFGKYLMHHPEVDELLPPESHVYFELAGEEEFNRYGRELAEGSSATKAGHRCVCASRAWPLRKRPD